MNDQLTKLSTDFERNIQESQIKIQVQPADLDGVPEDYIKAHKPNADGTITLTSDNPDVLPVEKIAKSADLRAVCTSPTARARTRKIWRCSRTFENAAGAGRSAGLQTLGRPERRGQNGAHLAKHQQLHRRDRQSLEAGGRTRISDGAGDGAEERSLDHTGFRVDRDFYYEQVRRTQFDFNSQLARPYLPYDKVQQGISGRRLETFSAFASKRSRMRWCGIRRSARLTCTTPRPASSSAAFISTCIRARQRPVVQRQSPAGRKKGRANSGGCADLQFRRRQNRRSRPDGIFRRHRFFHELAT